MQKTDFVATVFDGHGNPAKVTVALTMALNALEQGHSATLILMVEGVELGRPNVYEDMDIGAPFRPVKDLWADFVNKGGQIAVCGACMIHNGFTAEQMDSRYHIINAPQVVELLMNAKGTLPIT
ncbi:MAG: DsrE family protein [Neisseriaceae bacterium]|nr:DsrE family protein [Neisseriaceae bacterium]